MLKITIRLFYLYSVILVDVANIYNVFFIQKHFSILIFFTNYISSLSCELWKYSAQRFALSGKTFKFEAIIISDIKT